MDEPSYMLDWQPADAGMAALCLARALGSGDDAALLTHMTQQQSHIGDVAARLQLMLGLVSDMAAATEGLDAVLELIAAAARRDSAAAIYGLTADYIALYGAVTAEDMRLLERLGEALALDRLTRAALDAAAQARAVRL